MKSNPSLVVVVGETASGKSALAMKIAAKFNGEIINADSRQLYKDMDIGTAKPVAAERALVPHHLLDVVSPAERFTVADYKNLAIKAIKNISRRGKLPILVGGSGLYIDSVLFDYRFIPGDISSRDELARLTTQQLLARINQQGISTIGVDTSNRRRLMRLLETGGKRSGRSKAMRPNTLIVGLKIPRAELTRRITDRIDGMLSNGFEAEVRGVANKYGWEAEAMHSIGYRAFRGLVEGQKTLEQAKADFLQGDLNLAKKQRTWFKRNLEINWVENPGIALDMVRQFLE